FTKQKSDAGTRTIGRPCKQPQSLPAICEIDLRASRGLLSEKMGLSLAPARCPLMSGWGQIFGHVGDRRGEERGTVIGTEPGVARGCRFLRRPIDRFHP